MPHIIVEYTDNLKDRVDASALLACLHTAAISSGSFVASAIRSRVVMLDLYRVGDGHPDNAFIHVTIRIRPGRDEEEKTHIGTVIFQALQDAVAPALERGPLGVTMELQEIELKHRYLADSLQRHASLRVDAAP